MDDVLSFSPPLTVAYRLLQVVQRVDNDETEILSACADHLRKLTQVSAAAEVYEKMGNTEQLIALYVETYQWDKVSWYHKSIVKVKLAEPSFSCNNLIIL